jgi:hypothetical protein
MTRGRLQQCRDAPITMGQPVGDTFEHPSATQIQAVDMGKLRVGTVCHDRRLQPRRAVTARNSRQES